MPSQKNQDLLVEIKSHLGESKSVVVANYSGLDVTEQNELRVKLSEAGADFMVTRNRIFKIAAKEVVKDGFDKLEAVLDGQNAFLFSKDDAVSALKALFKFAEDHEKLQIKVGILDDKVLTFEETEALSKLPSKKELIGQLISRIQGPAYGMVNVLAAPTRNLVYALNAIAKKA